MRYACLGKYDALHRGHAANVAAAHAAGGTPLLVTFSGMAQALGWPARSPWCAPDERQMILAGWGVEELVLPFAEVRDLTITEFVQMLHDHHQISGICIGSDFRGGKNRHADAEHVADAARELGMQVCISDLVQQQHAQISSTAARQALVSGAIDQVTSLLGRYHANRGLVVRGDQRGRTIGWPTANLSNIHGLVPGPGVYVAWASFLQGNEASVSEDASEELIPAMVNIGTQPTIGDARPQRVEAHLIDWRGDAYDRPMRLAWVRRIRGEQTFANLDQLKAQLAEDRDAAETILAAIPDIETDEFAWPNGLPH
jgi:riboflavin kinase/FMN adenylyltransferase